MKLSIPRTDLKAALARVRPAVQRNGSHAALAGVLIGDAGDNAVYLACTNLDVRIATNVACDVMTPGKVLVLHDALDRIVTTTKTQAIELVVEDEYLHLTAGRGKFRLRTLDASSFPAPPQMHSPQEAVLDDDWAGIQRVLHARGTDDNRPIMTGPYLADGGVVATDSYRLAQHDLKIAGVELLLAPTSLLAAVKTCPAGPVTLRWSGQQYELEAADTVWSGRTIEGEFPRTAGLFPPDPPRSFTVEREALVDAVRAVGAVGEETHLDKAGKEYQNSIVRLTLLDDAIVVQCRSRDVGDGEVTLDATCVGEAGLEVAFDTRYLLPLLNELRADNVTFVGVNELKPWVAREGGFAGLLMPVRIPKPVLAG